MLDMKDLHAALQFPASIVLDLTAVMLLLRWRWAMTHAADVTPRPIDPVVTLLLAALFLSLAASKHFWAVWGALEAAELINTSEAMRSGHPFPIICNAATCVIGLLLFSRVSSVWMRPAVAFTVTASMASFLGGIGLILATR